MGERSGIEADRLREQAKAAVKSEIFAYIERAAGGGDTHRRNLSAYSKYKFVPRVLRGVTTPSLETAAAGRQLATPIMIAPTAWHSLYHPHGEAATALAAKRCGANFVLSCFSSMGYETIQKGSRASLDHTWQQLLIHKDEEGMRGCIELAYRAGCRAIALTVDAPSGCRMCKADAADSSKTVGYAPRELPLLPRSSGCRAETLDQYYTANLDPSVVTWERVRSLIRSSPLPVILKGILSVRDALVAKEVGAAGIVVSNHGGRQMGEAISTLEALAQIKKHPTFRNESQFELYLDGGIRTGQDVLKACALGARAVLVGRPTLYGLSIDGERGVESMLRTLESELSASMREVGCGSLSELEEGGWITPSAD